MGFKDFVVGAMRKVLGSQKASEVAESVAASDTARQVAADAARSPTARKLVKQAAESEFVRDVAREVVTSELAKDLASKAASRAAEQVTQRVKSGAEEFVTELFGDDGDDSDSAVEQSDAAPPEGLSASERRAAEERANWDRQQAEQRRDWAAAQRRQAEAQKELEIDDELAALKKKLGKS